LIDNKIKKIVLTGGPCAGKTTVFEAIADNLRNKGYYVITIGETATELIKNNFLPSSNKEHILMFQDIVLKTQYIKESVAEIYAEEIAKKQKVIILCDRGILDNRAYLESQEDFEFILNKNNLDEFHILNKYDLVIDLLSTASYKKESYELNGIRSESVEEAEALDKKTSMAWMHHNNMKIIKPTEKIEDKILEVLNVIDGYLNNGNCNNKKIYKLESINDLSVFNSENSKQIDIMDFHLDNGKIIRQKNYRNSVVYMCDNEIIDPNQFTDYLYENKILYLTSTKEIIFIEDGNIYKIINNSNNELYLECDSNLNLSNEKSLVKRKKTGNI